MVERRAVNVELRAAEDRTITGYAAVFDSFSEPIGGPFSLGGGFKENIAPRAFDSCLHGNPDVRCLRNHDPNFLLGRTKACTLSLSTDATGLRYRCALPNSQLGEDVYQAVKRGDISGSSFGFAVKNDAWDEKRNVRTLLDVDLYDVGPVTFPAYSQTTVQARSANGRIETIALGWYRTRGLHLPLTTQQEMRQRVKQLRQELGGGADDDECDCPCLECEDGNCESCSCESGCTGVGCESDDGETCHCASTRAVKGRMKPPVGQTIYPVDRWLLQRERELEQTIFDARQAMKLARR
jgi:HK97 family phage prohead protease